MNTLGRNQSTSLVILLFLTVFACFPLQLNAKTFNVSSIQEIQDALSEAQSNGENDIINIAEGTYYIDSTLLFQPTEINSLTIHGTGFGKTILDGKGLHQILKIKGPSISFNNGVYSIEEITFQNGLCSANGGAVIIEADESDISISKCKFSNNSAVNNGGGLYCTTGRSNLRFGNISVESCIFEKNLAYQGGGFYASIPSSNEVSMELIKIKNNLIYENSVIGGNGGGLFVSVFFNAKIHLINNTITNNSTDKKGGGVFADGRGYSGTYLYNNIIWGNSTTETGGGKDIYCFSYSTLEIKNNFYDNLSYKIFDTTTYINTNNISNSNPAFLNANDFHILSGSPCIDSGINSYLSSLDLDGNQRIYNNTVDIGAYEYNSVPITNYTISITKIGTGSGKVTGSPAGIDCGTDCSESYSASTSITLTAIPETGSSFDGWYSGDIKVSSSLTYSITMDQNKTVIANFYLKTVNLTVNIQGTGSGLVESPDKYISCTSNCTKPIYPNVAGQLTAYPSEGSVFAGWLIDGVVCANCNNNPLIDSISKDSVITAIFNLKSTPEKKTVNLVKGGTGTGKLAINGTDCETNCTKQIDSGTTITILATPDLGSIFAGWFVDNSPYQECNNAECQITANNDIILTALFSKLLKNITIAIEGSGVVASTPTGIICPGNCSTTFDLAAEIILTATPASGAVFKGWYSGENLISKELETTLSSQENLSIKAVFENSTSDSSGEQSNDGGSGGGKSGGCFINSTLQ